MKCFKKTFSSIQFLEIYKLFNLLNGEKMKFYIIALIVFIVVDHTFQGKYDNFELYFIIFTQKSYFTSTEVVYTISLFRFERLWADIHIASEIIFVGWQTI